MAQVREGSVIDVTIKEASGVGTGDVTFLGVTVVDITRDGLTYDDGTNTWLFPWFGIRRIKLITH